VLHLAQATDVPVHRHIVWRVGEDHLRFPLIKETAIDFGVRGIAADQRMITELPHVADTADDRSLFVDLNGLFFLLLAGFQPVEQSLDLGDIEPRERKVEVAVEFGDCSQLQREQVVVPAGQLGEPVVGNDIGPLLGLRHVFETQHGHRRHTEQLCCLDPAVARDHLSVPVDQNRVGKAKAFDARRDLLDLFLRVGARIAFMRPEIGNSHGFEPFRLDYRDILHVKELSTG